MSTGKYPARLRVREGIWTFCTFHLGQIYTHIKVWEVRESNILCDAFTSHLTPFLWKIYLTMKFR